MATIKLFENWLQSQAINELAPHGKLDLSVIDSNYILYLTINLTEEQNLMYERIKTLLKRNGVKFSTTHEKAARILTEMYVRLESKFPGWKANGGVDAWFKKTGDLKLMDFPEDPSKVLTTGIFTADEIQEPADDSQSSTYEDIALYCNNAALSEIARHLYVLRNQNSQAGLSGAGYSLSTGSTGTLQWTRQSEFKVKFYGTMTTTSAASKQTATTTTWEVPATGKTIVKKLPGTMFATGAATLADSKELDAAIAELKALIAADKNTKLAKIEVESSASGDRPAADGKSGYPANHPKGTPYTPKTAAESGNAKLAFDRAATIITKLASLGVPTSTKALIQDGGDAAQYAKLIVTVQKADKPAEVLSKTDLETILLKPKQETGLASTKTLSVWTAITNPQGTNF
jgi:hypothetical protein